MNPCGERVGPSVQRRLSPEPKVGEFVTGEMQTNKADKSRIGPDTLPEINVVVEQIENNGSKIDLEWATGFQIEGRT